MPGRARTHETVLERPAASVAPYGKGVFVAFISILSVLMMGCQQSSSPSPQGQGNSSDGLFEMQASMDQQWVHVDPALVRSAAPPLPFSDAEIRSYVRAGLAILEIENKWNPSIRGALDLGNARELKRQAYAEMARAVRDTGINVETYNRINDAALNNADLKENITRYRRTFGQKAR